jgi:hypothetical protein
MNRPTIDRRICGIDRSSSGILGHKVLLTFTPPAMFTTRQLAAAIRPILPGS